MTWEYKSLYYGLGEWDEFRRNTETGEIQLRYYCYNSGLYRISPEKNTYKIDLDERKLAFLNEVIDPHVFVFDSYPVRPLEEGRRQSPQASLAGWKVYTGTPEEFLRCEMMAMHRPEEIGVWTSEP